MRTIKKSDLEPLHGPMAASTLVNGKMVLKMDSEYTQVKKVRNVTEFGSRANVYNGVNMFNIVYKINLK